MYYIGLMAGTSFDGIDVALTKDNTLIASYCLNYDDKTKAQLLNLVSQTQTTLGDIAKLDITLGELFANATNQLLAKTQIKPNQIIAIGSHGQTIYHAPGEYSWQIANPSIYCSKNRNYRCS